MREYLNKYKLIFDSLRLSVLRDFNKERRTKMNPNTTILNFCAPSAWIGLERISLTGGMVVCAVGFGKERYPADSRSEKHAPAGLYRTEFRT